MPFLQLFQQARDVARVILQVRVDGDDDLARSLFEAGAECGRLAMVAAKSQNRPARVALMHDAQGFEAAVAAAIIDHDDFAVTVQRIEHVPQLPVQRGDGLCFVVQRNDDGERRSGQDTTSTRGIRRSHNQPTRPQSAAASNLAGVQKKADGRRRSRFQPDETDEAEGPSTLNHTESAETWHRQRLDEHRDADDADQQGYAVQPQRAQQHQVEADARAPCQTGEREGEQENARQPQPGETALQRGHP